MKKILILFIAVMAFAAVNLQAQDNIDIVNLEVELVDVFDLDVDPAQQNVKFTFDAPLEWTDGMDAPDSGLPTVFTVAATQDWQVEIIVPDLAGPVTMEADNLGVYCASAGSNNIGAEVACAYIAPGSILPLPNVSTVLMGNGTGNAGNATENIFELYFECGTMQTGMQALNMLDQVAAGTLQVGVYTTIATLTLSVAP